MESSLQEKGKSLRAACSRAPFQVAFSFERGVTLHRAAGATRHDASGRSSPWSTSPAGRYSRGRRASISSICCPLIGTISLLNNSDIVHPTLVVRGVFSETGCMMPKRLRNAPQFRQRAPALRTTFSRIPFTRALYCSLAYQNVARLRVAGVVVSAHSASSPHWASGRGGNHPLPNREPYALSAGTPPRWAYSTRDPGGNSPRRTLSIKPCIDLPS